ncbi:MAG: ATP-NAD kinase [Candidatus Heimdallarchaeota archaeon]|nr:ATP-NAD kinase [Candidatus Heimdallarchaeota archaeon]
MIAMNNSLENPKENNEPLLVGLIINPIAGVGGRIGLKGSDDADEIWRRLKKGTAEKIAEDRAKRFLKSISNLKDGVKFLCFGGEMGENALEALDFNYETIGHKEKEKPTSEDTIRAAKKMLEAGIDLLTFVGGDGTACDIYEAVEDKIPILAVPSGVKMHSACFALNPEIAGSIFKQFYDGQLNITLSEVMDIDEEAFRAGRVSAELKGMIKIPYLTTALQGGKMASPSTEDEQQAQRVIAKRVNEDMELDTLYLLGSGSTCKAVADEIGVDKTLLGVDAIYNRELIKKDVNEKEILELLEKYPQAKIIVTIIGNQGFIFGRGNQQFSPEVIRKVGKNNIILIGTVSKLERTEKLRVDTGDPELDKGLQGFIRVITSYHEDFLMRIEG